MKLLALNAYVFYLFNNKRGMLQCKIKLWVLLKREGAYLFTSKASIITLGAA